MNKKQQSVAPILSEQDTASMPNAQALQQSPQPSRHDSAKAKNMLHAVSNAAAVVQEYGRPFGELETINELCGQLITSNEEMRSGDMSSVEEMLFDQAHALQAIFSNMAKRAGMNIGNNMALTEAYLRLALKAQNQCRTTLESLALIKNPQPTAFIKQQNIAANQQVNNETSTRAHARNSEKSPNKLSRSTNDDKQQLEFAASPATVRSNREVETVEAINWPKNSRRKGNRS